MDTAKAAGVVAANGGSIGDYEGAMKFTNPLPPLVCVPTTHGTGSEVSYALVITDEERKFKYFVGSPLIAPKVAVLDPILMVNLPAHLAAATGMDALSHAIESFCSTRSQPFSECLALHSIRLTAANLRKAVTTDDLEATYNMVIASSLGMMAGSLTRLGTVHAMAHALGSLFHTHHGLACGLLMPYVMEFNMVSCPEKFAMIAQAMGEQIEGLGVMDAAQMAVGAVQDLCIDIGIPETLGELGVTEDSIPAWGEGTRAGNVATNPRKTAYEDVEKLFKAAL
jgi:alcohol dehydrogenase class IV